MVQTKTREPVLPSLETFLNSEKLLSPQRAVELLRYMSSEELTAGSAVMRLKWVTGADLGQRLSKAFSIPMVTANSIGGIKMRKVLTEDKIRAWQAVPIDFSEDNGTRKLILGMTDPLHRAIQQSAEALTRVTIQPAFLPWEEYEKICEIWFG